MLQAEECTQIETINKLVNICYLITITKHTVYSFEAKYNSNGSTLSYLLFLMTRTTHNIRALLRYLSS